MRLSVGWLLLATLSGTALAAEELQIGGAPAPPAQSSAAGFRNLVYGYEFTTLDVGASEAGGDHAWWTVPPRWERTPPNWKSAYLQSGRTATLTTRAEDNWPQIHLISNITNSSGRNDPQNGSFLHGYFEARLRFDMPIGAWPAFWLFSSRHLATNNPRDWSEIDIVEGQGDTPDRLYCTIHWWEDTRRNHQNNPVARMPTGFDPRQFHRYGLLWVPGQVTWYVDDRAVLNAPTWPINDTDPVSIIISAQANGWSKANHVGLGEARSISVEASWVRVWQ